MPNGAFESRKAAQVNAPEENVWRYKINDNPTGGGGIAGSIFTQVSLVRGLRRGQPRPNSR